MILSDIAVKRPVLAAVLSLLLVVAGVMAFLDLPLREYPNIDPPIVSIVTAYPGASADIVETRVTRLIEDRISGIEGIRTIRSRSRDGQSEITIEFNLNRDIDGAANDVRDRTSRVLADLPEEADPPEVSRADADAEVMMWINFASTSLDLMALTDYAERYVVDRFSVIDGVARVQLGGSRRYSMRIWLDRAALAARRLTVNDVEQALRRENVELPGGRIESIRRELTVRVARNYRTPEDFGQMVLAQGADGYLVRLADVARVEVAPADLRSEIRGNGVEMISLGIIRQSQANTLEVARKVKAELARIQPTLPEGVKLHESYDSSIFVEEAVKEVYVTLAQTAAVVVVVIFFFLGSVRGVLVPAVTVPISLIASLSALWMLGFSLNLLTLLALVLAIGMVVDDAIVVLENCYRRVQLGEPPLLAAYRGARQVGFAVVATTVVLVAVFVPISFMQGNIGRLFREFSLAIAAAICFSTLVALTLSPMMCSKLLRPRSRRNWLVRGIEGASGWLERRYRSALDRVLDHPLLVLAVLAAVVVMVGAVARSVPSELAPPEDRGAFFVMARTAEGSSFLHAHQQAELVEQDLMPLIESGEAKRILVRVPMSRGTTTDVIDGARGIVLLEHWDKRTRSTSEIIAEVSAKLNRHPGMKPLAMMRQALAGSSTQPVQFVLGGSSYAELARWRDIVLAKAAENPGLVGLDADYKETKPQLIIDIDRDRAADLGVPVETIGRTLETFLAGRRVTTYLEAGEEYDVMLEGRDEDGRSPADLTNIYVRSDRSGELIPLANLLTTREAADAVDLNRFNRLRAVTIQANLAPGYRLGEALDYLENIARTHLPPTAQIDYQGESREFRESSRSLYIVFLLALLVVFLVLAAQFESFVHPLVIMLTVPLAMAGAMLGLYFAGSSLNVYSQIGIIMLVGLAAKNGILIVEFANQLRDEGQPFREALLRASETRLRPILMTGLSTSLGAIPLVFATGAGSASRQTIGIVVFFGLTLATFLTLFVVPVFYNMLGRLSKSPGALERELARLDVEIPSVD